MEGWEISTLGLTCEVTSGQSPKGEFINNKGEGLPFHQGKKEFQEKYLGPSTKWASQITRVADMGDIVMSVRAPVGPINFVTEQICIGRGLAAIRAGDCLNNEFLFYALLAMQDQITGSEGAVFASINRKQIQNLSIPLPPLPEQERIVAMLDEAFAAIDTATANTVKNLANAKELFESELAHIFTAKNDRWVAQRLSELGKITSSKRIYKREYTDSGVPFYRTKEVKEKANGRNITTELFISEERYDEIKQNFGVPLAGDILLTAIGTIGEIFVVEGQDEFYFKDGNVLWLKEFQSVDPYFLRYVLMSFVKNLNRLARGAAYNALPIEKLKNHVIYLPPAAEQGFIVKKLDALSGETKILKTIFEEKQVILTNLKQSLLQKAFTGELTAEPKVVDRTLSEASV